MNTVAASFKTTVRQTTEMSQRKKTGPRDLARPSSDLKTGSNDEEAASLTHSS